VITPMIAVYLGGWMMTTMAALVAARSVADKWRPPTIRTFAIASVLAGALWPMLLLGFVEAGSVRTYIKLTHT
jgi:hypothetical protein